MFTTSKCKKILLVILAVFLFLAILSVKVNAATENITFDAEYYLNNYTDLKKAFKNNYEAAYEHFMQYGISEGRTASVMFDVRTYVDTYDDLKNTFGNNYRAAYDHFMQYGINEGRKASDSFDVISYINNYSDLKNAIGTNYEAAYEHYATFGMKEGRIATHSHSYQAEITAPTTESEGYTTYTCSCGESYVSDYVPALEPEVEEPEIPNSEAEPNVQSEGSLADIVNGNATTPQNDYEENVVPEEKTEEQEHVHTFTDWEITIPSTCNRFGEKQRSCSCGYIQKEMLTTLGNHVYQDTYKVEATCLQDGKIVKSCKNCDYTFTQILPQTGHRWIDKSTIESTCTGAQTTCECEYCHIETTFTSNYAGTGHTWADPNGSTDFVGNYCTKCGQKAPTWTNDWALNVYDPLFEEIWEKEHDGAKYEGALPNIYELSEAGLKEFRERISQLEGGNRTRGVWYVGFYADKTKCAGFDGERDGYILKTVITADWKFEVTAPDAKPGYEFKGWINKVTGEKVGEDRTIITTWRDKDKTIEAVYEHV